MEKTINSDSVYINGTEYVPKSKSVELLNKEGKRCVLIRSYAAGVHFGFLEKEEFTQAGKVVTLIDSRRIWYWEGAASLSQLAIEGVKNPDKCKFSVSVPKNEIVNIIETIDLSIESYNQLSQIKEWKV